MTKTAFSLLAATALLWAGCSTTTTEEGGDADTVTVMNEGEGAATSTTTTTTTTVATQLSESDSYVDLSTGKPIRIRMNESGLYTGDLGDLRLYVNTTTGDTFYGGEAYRVNGHLMRSGDTWDVDQTWLSTQSAGMNNDPTKVRVEEDGDYKMKYKEGDIKEKLKVDGDGKDMKYKYKDDEADAKIKMTEDQIKVKDASGKTEIESDGSVKHKPAR